jgi:hypothetical protein
MKRCYLSGAITGVPNYRETFAKYADKLRLAGYTVFNPASANLEGWPEGKILAHELEWILTQADSIALIPGYENSRGVKLELAAAEFRRLEVIHL